MHITHDCMSTQVAFLVKIYDETDPPNDCPRVFMAVFMKCGQDVQRVVDYTAIGKGSLCTHRGLQEYCYDVPWAAFFHGSNADIPRSVLEGHFVLDMFDVREIVRHVYKVSTHVGLGPSHCNRCL